MYAARNYDGALDVYSGIESSGEVSGNLFYNIGNCYAKKGMYGKAIVNYERALALSPQDTEARANYKFVLSEAGNPREISPVTGVRSYILKLFSALTLNGLTVTFSIVLFILIACAAIAAYPGGPRQIFLPAALVFLIAVVISGVALKDRIDGLGRDAIIVAKNVEVKFEPFAQSTTYFDLEEGDKVRINDTKDGWSRVIRSDGRQGWVAADTFEII
jgi:tetratricopeptide (TPR) repeat protein